jgi:hypothetical protein
MFADARVAVRSLQRLMEALISGSVWCAYVVFASGLDAYDMTHTRFIAPAAVQPLARAEVPVPRG